jgi:hypothetical protein
VPPTRASWSARQPLAGPDAAPDVELSAGRFYPILVEVDRIAAADARIRLEWTAPHGARFPRAARPALPAHRRAVPCQASAHGRIFFFP